MLDNSLVDLDLLSGACKGSAGTAVVIKNCLARCAGEVGAAIRAINNGTLIQVWKVYDDVQFSVLLENYLQLDDTCLVCKSSDIARVPPSLWGALLPLSEATRMYIAQRPALAERLAEITIGSHVQVNDGSKHIGQATVVKRLCNPNGLIGVYYGINYVSNGNFSNDNCDGYRISSIEDAFVNFECDAVVDLSRILLFKQDELLLKSTVLERERTGLPKSASHNALSYEDGLRMKRCGSSNLDPSNKSKSMSDYMQKPLNPNIVPVHMAKTHSTSRSLDLPTSTVRRLTRDRACASLDSGNSVSKKQTEVNIGPAKDPDDLTVGSMIEFMPFELDELYYGVIRWMGTFPGTDYVTVGVELEEEIDTTDRDEDPAFGLFKCAPNKAYFLRLSQCRRDTRFQETHKRSLSFQKNEFGHKECPSVKGTISPLSRDVREVCGKNKGIQGHNNSCYLDATLFAMFAFTSVFDSVLYRPQLDCDHVKYSEVQRVLRDEIVNPLRKNIYVRADKVMKLRTLLDKLSSVTGLTSEEKDPEEFLNSLLMQILKAEPFLQLSSGQEAFYYQLFVEKDERLHVPSVQQLIQQSFLSSDIKLKQLPSCLIVQMPRFGKSFKMYPRIIPSTTIDVTDLIEYSPRQCVVCGKLAYVECKECYSTEELEGGSFCMDCMRTAHNHPSRQRHQASRLSIPSDCEDLLDTAPVPRLTMELFAVLCIETSHYVAFLNTKEGWVFFDSMADRKGEQNGYNIPEIVHCPDLAFWLTEEGAKHLTQVEDERELPTLAKRLLCDAYMCMYQSPLAMMYRYSGPIEATVLE